MWKWVGGVAGPRLLAEFPPAVVRAQPDPEDVNDETPTMAAQLVKWALASATGEVPHAWQPPARELVESWLSAGGLTIQSGPFVSQGEHILKPDRWALRFPILSRVPPELPRARREWLRLVLADGQSIWRMVRLALTSETDNAAVLASIDLTGAPPCEELFLASLDAIKQAVIGLAETVELLADDSSESELLATPPSRNSEKTKPNTEH